MTPSDGGLAQISVRLQPRILPGALLCPYESEDPAFRRSGRLPNLRYGDQVRAVWVTRFDFHDHADIVRIMQRSAHAGFNTVFFQVRGNASTYYPSKLEPWSEAYGWKSPGFDPLQLAIGEAHAKGMALHAWINVMPLWRGLYPPSNPDHLYCSHPEWSWYDKHGKRQPLTRGFYVSLNPCLPETRQHIVQVCKEIVSQYQIDGLHLDYIRFPNEKPVVNGSEYSRDKRTVELFQEETGLSSPDEKPAVWDQWRCDCVTTLLRDIRRTCKSLQPQMVLTAAVGAERKQAMSKFQDVEQWWKERLLDAVVPMNYTSCPRTFRIRVEHEWQHRKGQATFLKNSKLQRPSSVRKSRTRWWMWGRQKQKVDAAVAEWSRPPEPAIIMGTSLEFGESRHHQKQLALALQRFGHFSVFCYSSLFGIRGKPEVNRSSLSLLPFLKILADASLLLVHTQVSHPFRAKDIATHPEETFPYDQLHLYNEVPQHNAYSRDRDRRTKARAWGQQPGGRRIATSSGDVLRLNRRTFRRGLQDKQMTKETFLRRGLRSRKHTIAMVAKEKDQQKLLIDSSEAPLTMQSWEAQKMSEATEVGRNSIAPSRLESKVQMLNQGLRRVYAVEKFGGQTEHVSTGSTNKLGVTGQWMVQQGSNSVDYAELCCLSTTSNLTLGRFVWSGLTAPHDLFLFTELSGTCEYFLHWIEQFVR